MRAVIQRVKQASVTVDGEVISKIGKGLCVLIGISKHDEERDAEFIVRKILNLRLWDDDEKGKRWMYSLKQQKLEVLCVSQFTLYHVIKGNSPDFHNAMPGEKSQEFFERFIEQMKSSYDPQLVQVGKFGHKMQVDICGDGPVTINIESPPPPPPISNNKLVKKELEKKSKEAVQTTQQEQTIVEER